MKKFDFATGYDVSALPTYVEQHRGDIIRDLIIGADSLKYFRKQLGVKGTSALNIMTLDPTIVCGGGCGFEAGNAPALVQKDLKTCLYKINLEICPEQLAGTWAEYAVQVEAKKTELPFEDVLLSLLRDKIHEGLEGRIWMGGFGDTPYETDCCEGIFVQLANEDLEAEGSYGDSAWEFVYNAITKYKTLTHYAGDIIVFADPTTYDFFAIDTMNRNLFHVAPDADPFSLVIPGTRTRLVKVPALAYAGSALVISAVDNLYFGTDRLDNPDAFDVWYSKDADVWRVKAKWNAGATYAFSDRILQFTNTDKIAPIGLCPCGGGDGEPIS